MFSASHAKNRYLVDLGLKSKNAVKCSLCVVIGRLSCSLLLMWKWRLWAAQICNCYFCSVKIDQDIVIQSWVLRSSDWPTEMSTWKHFHLILVHWLTLISISTSSLWWFWWHQVGWNHFNMSKCNTMSTGFGFAINTKDSRLEFCYLINWFYIVSW